MVIETAALAASNVMRCLATRLIGSLEYRHRLEGDGRADLGGVVTLNRLALLLPMPCTCMVDRPGCRRDVFYDVGYGLRFIGDMLNIAPGSLQIDFGVPRSLPR
ncbi:MAG: hypothetical protein R3C68_07900 [Myxococcota bacterium]